MTYGPFVDGCDPALRGIYLAELRALCRVLVGPAASEAVKALSSALDAPSDDSRLAQAREAVNAIPPVPRRRILASFAALRREVADAI